MTRDASQPTYPVSAPRRARRPRAERPPSELLAGGPSGNERLTVITGLLLLVLFAVLGVTIVRIGQLLWLHLFLGLVLLGPIALKLGSTGYRFARYYTSSPAYREQGPPAPVLRGLAPLVVFFTLAVFVTGVALLLLGPSSRQPLLLWHKLSFFAWLGVFAIHVLGHLPRIVRIGSTARASRRVVLGGAAEPRAHPVQTVAADASVPGGRERAAALTVALLGGLILAVALVGQFSVWTH